MFLSLVIVFDRAREHGSWSK